MTDKWIWWTVIVGVFSLAAIWLLTDAYVKGHREKTRQKKAAASMSPFSSYGTSREETEDGHSSDPGRIRIGK